MDIQEELFRLQDKKYADFTAKLIPNISPETIIGVRSPAFKKFAKTVKGTETAEIFCKRLPHRYFEENNLHAFLISEEKDFNQCIRMLDTFLPYVDNWATCDSLSPDSFKKNLTAAAAYGETLLRSDHIYTVRFGIGIFMRYFLDEHFDIKYPTMISALQSNAYYLNMMIAWYFATALAKQYDRILPFLEKQTLDLWTHNKTIQKAIESYRITDEQKQYLRTLKIKAKRTVKEG